MLRTEFPSLQSELGMNLKSLSKIRIFWNDFESVSLRGLHVIEIDHGLAAGKRFLGP